MALDRCKQKVAVVIREERGPALHGCFSLDTAPSGHAGPERLREYLCGKRGLVPLALRLRDGFDLLGEIVTLPGQSQLVDCLNQAVSFAMVRDGDAVHLVNKRFISGARPVPAPAPREERWLTSISF